MRKARGTRGDAVGTRDGGATRPVRGRTPEALLPQELRDYENNDSAAEAAAAKEINQRIACCGYGKGYKGEFMHVGLGTTDYFLDLCVAETCRLAASASAFTPVAIWVSFLFVAPSSFRVLWRRSATRLRPSAFANARAVP